MCQGVAAYEATGAALRRTYFFALLAEAYGRAGQVAEGLRLLAQALTVVRTNGEQVYEAELYRLQGELLLAQAGQGQRPTGPREADAEPACSRPSPWPAASRPSPWSCGRR